MGREDDIPGESIMTTLTKAPEYYWHVHHEVLCEALTEPIQNRISYIRSTKPKGEVETRLRCMTPVLHPERLPVEWSEAYAKRREADAKRREADAKLSEAYAKRSEADAKWEEADAKWREAYAELEEAGAKWREADAKWSEACAKWSEAYAKCLPQIEALHKKEHPDCPWDGKTIFP